MTSADNDDLDIDEDLARTRNELVARLEELDRAIARSKQVDKAIARRKSRPEPGPAG